MKKYTGGCHCGAVTFEIEADITEVMACNCSHCKMKGFLLVFIPAEQFTLHSGEENLTEYLFNKKHIHHMFCKTCGTEPFARGADSSGKETVAINVRCLTDLDYDSLPVKEFNGKDY